jgi:hypothetical protein
MAAVMVWPAAICVKRHGAPAGHTTASGRVLQSELKVVLGLHEVVLGAPSWPSKFVPQQYARPDFVSAQV